MMDWRTKKLHFWIRLNYEICIGCPARSYSNQTVFFDSKNFSINGWFYWNLLPKMEKKGAMMVFENSTNSTRYIFRWKETIHINFYRVLIGWEPVTLGREGVEGSWDSISLRERKILDIDGKLPSQAFLHHQAKQYLNISKNQPRLLKVS